jgi:hypothetical protein
LTGAIWYASGLRRLGHFSIGLHEIRGISVSEDYYIGASIVQIKWRMFEMRQGTQIGITYSHNGVENIHQAIKVV